MIQPVKKLLIKWEIRLKWKLKRGLMCRVRICTGNTRLMMEMGLGRKPRSCTNISTKQQMGQTTAWLLNQALLWGKLIGKLEEAFFFLGWHKVSRRNGSCKPLGWWPVFSYNQRDSKRETWKTRTRLQDWFNNLDWSSRVFMNKEVQEESRH